MPNRAPVPAARAQTLLSLGGAAINQFIRDMPRLSVDLDLFFSNQVSAGTMEEGLGDT